MRKRIIIALIGIGLALGGAGAIVQVGSTGHAVASPQTHYYGLG